MRRDGTSRGSRRTTAAATAYVALAATDTLLAGRTSTRARRARHVVKPLLMPALAAAFDAATPARQDSLVRGTTTALGLSWGGDMALLAPGERAFLAGLGSFAAAHVAYLAGFTSVRDRSADRDLTGVAAAAVLWGTAGPVMALAARRRHPGLALPVAGYAGVLAAMFAASTLVDPARDPRARRTLQAGTGLFLLSDALLGLQRFLLRDEHPVVDSAVMATYTAGQGLIAHGVAHL